MAWNPEANEIFLKALEMQAAEERRAYLDGACRSDLRPQVEALLAASEQAGSFLESPALGGTVDEPLTERPGTAIGPYRLMEQLGEGGMGLVFVAEQQQPVRRKVALKVLKPGMDTRQVVARFEAERQALALMDHPNIARVLDGGTTPAGRPYFVMELVKGAPITDYCDRSGLSVRERLGLFVDVCGAVQHAHQKGIIHRDLKPSNVLISSHDGTPVVKVIDFGVAKAIGQQLTDKTVYTQFAQLIGTPLYMAPEQAGESGLDVDTRSDIYALGVLLYELLTGTTPFDKDRFKEVGYDEMRRIIRQEEPPKPSTRISTLGQAATTVSTNRKSDPKRLSQLFRGDLDWIVMKALEKDRNRRYETASGFAADVVRYLHDQPVEACPPSPSYRLRKFARRNRAALTIAALILGVLLGGATISITLIWREKQQTQQEKENAETNYQAVLAAVGRYFSTVSESPELRRQGVERLRRDLLQNAKEFYEQFIAEHYDDPKLQAELGWACLRLGFITTVLGPKLEAIPLYQRAGAIFQRLRHEHPDAPKHLEGLVKSLSELANVHRETGRPEEAEAAYNEALVLLAERPPGSHEPERLRLEGLCLHNLGLVHEDRGRFADAEGSYKKALPIRLQLVSGYPDVAQYQADLALTQNNLGVLYVRLTRWEDAITAYKETIRINRGLVRRPEPLPEYEQRLAGGYSNLGVLYGRLQRWADAEDAHLKAIPIKEQQARDHPGVPAYQRALAISYTNLAIIYEETRRLAEAGAFYQKAHSIREQLVEQHREVPEYATELGGSFYNLGYLLNKQDEPLQALKCLDKARDLLREALQRKTPVSSARQKLRGTLSSRAEALADLGRMDEALHDLEEALELGKAIKEPPYREMSKFLATCPDPKFRDLARALDLAKKAVELAAKIPDQDCWHNLGMVQYRVANWQEARTALGKSIEARKGGDASDWYLLAMTCWRLGQKEEARMWYEKAATLMQKDQKHLQEIKKEWKELRQLQAEARAVLHP
jgi:serine/threonine protein kinase